MLDKTQSKITYHQQITYCGKPRCRKCREGIGHGPYWYAYQTVDGQTARTYIGKHLPPDVQATIETMPARTGDGDMSLSLASSSPDAGTPLLRILTLGQFRLERRGGSGSQPWQPITEAAWQPRQESQVRALLAYLLCSPERNVSRSQALATLWPGDDSAAQYLNDAVRNLRKILKQPSLATGQEAPRVGPALFQAEDEWLTLATQERVWIDADEFEEFVARLEEPLLHDPADPEYARAAQQREQLLREAIALYNGDFLPEERAAEWVIARRQQLRRSWIELHLELSDLYTAREALSDAVKILDRLLASDPACEPAVQRLIIVLARLKRRGEAFRVYQRFAGVLQRDYEALPSQETQALCEVVRQGGELPPHPLVRSTLVSRPRDGSRPTRDTAAEAIGRTHQSPLVGRDRELAVMRTMVLEVEQSAHLQLVSQRKASGLPLDTQRRPNCLVLMGDAGIGKTRLAEEMSREARRRGWAVVWSRLYTQESGVPYRVWTEALSKTLNIDTGLLPVLDPYLLQPLTALLPELDEMIPRAVLEQAPPPYVLTPEQERLRLWEAIGDLLKTISESTPLLIVLDDIQWADKSSHELLGYLARLLYGYPIMFVSTCRDSELPKYPPHKFIDLINHMQREHVVKTLDVEPLSSEQIALLVSSVSHLSEATVKHIQDHAAGNPFFAEELARSTPPTLPRTVTAALNHRMGRLSAACRQLLGNAAVLGGSFEFSLICAMESSARNDLADEDTVLTLLEEALQAGLLTDEGSGTHISYHFWHPLLVSHLYESVSALRRARLHRRAADVLQHMHHGREEEVAATIADHLLKAGAEPAPIAHFAELAGNRAYAVSAYSEAEQHYLRAVEHLEAEGSTVDQTRLLYLLERLAECTMIRGHYEEARRLYERVLGLRAYLQASRTNDQERDREAQVQALVLVEIGWTWNYTGSNEQAWQCCERGEHVLHEAGVVGGPAWARLYSLQSSLYRQEGQYEDALRVAQEALTLFEEQQERRGTSRPVTRTKETTSIQRTLEGDPINLGRIHRMMATIADSMGQLSRVLEHQGKALALYEQYNEQRQIAHLSCDIGYIHLKKAEYALARTSLQRALELAERTGDDPLISLVYGDLGKLAAASDELVEAEDWYRRALELAEERTKDREYMSTWNAGLATVLLAQGKVNEAITCLWRAWSIGRAMHNHPCIGLALVTLGNMRIAQAMTAEKLSARRERLLKLAALDLQRALELVGLDVETRTRGHLALAHIAFLAGRREEARQKIARVVEEAQRYELALVVMQARQLLEQVNS